MKRGLLIGAVLASAGACFSPNVDAPDCAIACISECPNGYDCRNGWCARSDSTATCGSAGAAGASDSAGSGGAFSAAGAGGTGAEAGSAAGTAGGGQATRPLTLGFTPNQGICQAQSYEIELDAAGGVQPYSWSIATDATGVSLSANTGAVVKLMGTADQSQPSITVTVKDAAGEKQTSAVTLNVLAVGAGLCPEVRSARLPAVCRNNPYFVGADSIAGNGGTAPFSWQAVSIPEGLQFDNSTQTLSGIISPAGEKTPLTLRVTDAKGRSNELTYPLEYRDKCWLGFTQNADSDTRLRLYDPALRSYAQSLELSSNNTGVVDFKFSPDGNLIAYRRVTADRSQQLVLLNVPTWQEQVLAIPGSVLSYSWAPGARFLAVAYLDAAGNDWLGGVDATDSDTSFVSHTAVPSLSPVQVMDSTHAKLSSDLLWLEHNALIAFHGDEQTSDTVLQEGPYFVAFDGTSFSTVTDFGVGYDSPLDLEPAKGGVFVIAGSAVGDRSMDFWNYAGDAADYYLKGALQSANLDPGGRYVAYPLHGQLEVAFTSQSGGTADPPSTWNLSRNGSVDATCGSIMAWNPTSEQVVCDAQLGAAPDYSGEVRLYDLDVNTKSALELPLSQLAGYHQGDAATRRRTFSPQSDLFAFTTRDDVFVASGVSAQVEFSMPLSPLVAKDQPGELAFAPDQSILLWLSGSQLGALALEKNGPQMWVDGLLPAQPCAEEFVSSPRSWCGRSTPASAIVWAPSSRFAAAMNAAHGVRVFDFSDFATPKLQWTDDACTANCNSDFVFQP